MISALEKINADAVIIVYNKNVDDIKNIVLGNPNGWGRHVKVPGVVITKEDGHKIKKYLDRHNNDKSYVKHIYVELDFNIERNDVVKYDIYFSNGYDQIYDLMLQLGPMHEALGDKVTFEPKYVSHKNYHYSEGLVNDCLAGGNYCMYNIDYFFNYNGRDLMLHNVQEKCIWKEVKDKPSLFLKYIENYVRCANKSNLMYDKEEECIEGILDKIGISKINVKNCYANDFKSKVSTKGVNMNDQNTLILTLENDRYDYITHQIVFLPSILINNRPYYVI
jgi:hypothetical protein